MAAEELAAVLKPLKSLARILDGARRGSDGLAVEQPAPVALEEQIEWLCRNMRR